MKRDVRGGQGSGWKSYISCINGRSMRFPGEMPSTFQARTLDRRIAICYMMYNILLNTVMRIYLLLNWQVILKTFVPVVRPLRGSV